MSRCRTARGLQQTQRGGNAASGFRSLGSKVVNADNRGVEDANGEFRAGARE